MLFLIFKCLSNFKMHIWCFKNLGCLSIAFRIKPKLFSIQWKENLPFFSFLTTHFLFPYPVPKKATFLGPLPCHQLPCRKGTWSSQTDRYLYTGLIKYPLYLSQEVSHVGETDGKVVNLSLHVCSLHYSQEKHCVGGGTGNCQSSITESKCHRGRSFGVKP